MRSWHKLLGRTKKGIRLVFKEYLVRIGLFSKPSFLIIGAQKGGTAALYRYLSAHPDIITGENEIGFFHKDRFYNKGKVWYHSHFPSPRKFGQHIVTFESTPEYLYYPKCAKRIFLYDPKIKLLVLLRDPVERAFSAWTMFRDLFHNRPEYLYTRSRSSNEAVSRARAEMLSKATFPGFDEAIQQEIKQMLPIASSPEPSYVRRGLYAEQLRCYFEYFSRDQVLVIDSRLLRNTPSDVLDVVVRLLNLPEYDWHQEQLPLYHIGKYEGTQVSDQSRAILREFYKPYNQELYELLGRDFGWQ